MKEEAALSRRELARLLRAFAALLEREDALAASAPRQRAPRKKAKAKAPMEPPSELTRARARAALRKLGALP